MIGHAIQFARTFYTVMIRKIKNGVLIKFRNHINPPVSSGRFYMLPESIAVPAGSRERNWRKNLHAVVRNTLSLRDSSLLNHLHTTLRDRESIFPIIQKHTHTIGQVRMQVLHI